MSTQPLRLKSIASRVIKATQLWKENHLLLRELKSFSGLVAIAIICSLIASGAAGLSTGFIGALLQGLTNPQAPPLSTGLPWIDNNLLGVLDSSSIRVYKLAGITLLAILIQTVFTYLGQLNLRFLAIGLVNRLRCRIFDQLAAMSLSFYQNTRPGVLMNTLTNEVNFIQQALISISNILIGGFVLIGYAISMIFLSWQLSLATAFVFGLLSLGFQKIRSQVRAVSFDIPVANQDLANRSLEFFQGIMTVQACNSQAYERQKLRAATQKVWQTHRRMAQALLRVPTITQSVASCFLIILIVISYSQLIRHGTMQGTSFLAFLFAISRALPIMVQISNARVNSMSLQGSLQSVNALLTRKDKPYFIDGYLPFERLQHRIDLTRVNYGHQSDQLILHDVTVSFEKGKTTALVGASGSGKTTLVNLIPRFFDPTSGQVLIDGVDARDLQIESLRARMAIVTQDTFIFNASVQENIAYGLPAVTDEALYQAAEQANALEFILQLPDGFETPLGDRGLRLSGGQRQRIAIARAILRDPEILILDEATSALDSVTERKIQDAMSTLSVGRTVIVIAHRLSTIVNADQIYVLDQGRVVEAGTFDALMDRQGQFWQYYQIQQSSPASVGMIP